MLCTLLYMPTQNYYTFFDFKNYMFTMEGNILVIFLFKKEKGKCFSNIGRSMIFSKNLRKKVPSQRQMNIRHFLCWTQAK